MEPQKTADSHSNLEKEEQSWKYHTIQQIIIQQGHNNQNSMVLA